MNIIKTYSDHWFRFTIMFMIIPQKYHHVIKCFEQCWISIEIWYQKYFPSLHTFTFQLIIIKFHSFQNLIAELLNHFKFSSCKQPIVNSVTCYVKNQIALRKYPVIIKWITVEFAISFSTLFPSRRIFTPLNSNTEENKPVRLEWGVVEEFTEVNWIAKPMIFPA